MTDFVATLYVQYRDSLIRMLHRRTGDRERAEELTQEVFARAVAAPPNNPRPWLFAVALNLVREEGRRASRQGRRLELYRVAAPLTLRRPDHATVTPRSIQGKTRNKAR